MAVILFDTDMRKGLFPLTYTKAVASLRFGALTIAERWQYILNSDVFIETVPYLQPLYPSFNEGIHTWINASLLADEQLVEAIKSLQQGEVLEDEQGTISCCGVGKNIHHVLEHSATNFRSYNGAQWLLSPHEILACNERFIAHDYKLLTQNKTTLALSETNRATGHEHIFIDENATVEFSIINAEKGPVYIGKNAVVMEGCLLRGPLVIGDNAVVKMGTKIYGATTIGPHCTAGGEIKNVVMQSFSNKAHDGYLGDSVIGEWCNFGAGASNSNVKNTAGYIKLWNAYKKEVVNAGNKCGVITGDHTRVAINSSINTGSVFGVCCNVFGEGLLPVLLRNFSWGTGGEGYTPEKAIKHIREWKNFKHQTLSAEEESVLTYIFDNFITDQQ